MPSLLLTYLEDLILVESFLLSFLPFFLFGYFAVEKCFIVGAYYNLFNVPSLKDILDFPKHLLF